MSELAREQVVEGLSRLKTWPGYLHAPEREKLFDAAIALLSPPASARRVEALEAAILLMESIGHNFGLTNGAISQHIATLREMADEMRASHNGQ